MYYYIIYIYTTINNNNLSSDVIIYKILMHVCVHACSVGPNSLPAHGL